MDKHKAKSKHFPVKRPSLFKKDKENRGKKGDRVDGKEINLNIKEGEKALQNLIKSDNGPTGELWNVHDIENIVTAKNLCACKDPITVAFEVNRKLRTLADTCTENTEFLNQLADQTEDFAVRLIDQVNAKEEIVIRDRSEHVDRYASMLSDMTDAAIIHSQKKFVAHPLLYKRLKMRWNLGLPDSLKPHGKFRALLYLLIVIDMVLTPILLPIVGYAFYRDQRKRREIMENTKGESESRRLTDERSPQDNLGKYLSYYTTPMVIFVKDKLSQLAFIAFHVRVCVLASTVYPRLEEYLIFVFFTGLVLTEFQQYKASPLKYFKDMWNYLDVITLLIYLLIVVLRIATIARGGDPYHNRLLEFVNYLYGVNTMLLVLRFSSILELSSVVGPLQLALFRMLIDLLIILVQFCFVIMAFSVAITKSYVAEISYLTSTDNHTEDVTKYNVLFKTSRQLIWSVFGLTDLEQMETHTSLTSDIVAVLYLIFLVFSVIMLVNMLVALLTNTYDNVTTNAEVEWKFSRAVVENQYRNLHSIVVPFNLLSAPMELCYFSVKRNSREEDAQKRREDYKTYYRDRLFPTITRRYSEKYGGSFPLSVEEKIDLIMEKLKISNSDKNVPGKQAEYNLGDTEDLIKDSTSVVVRLQRNDNQPIANAADFKPSLTDSQIQISSIV
ncbi:hypothetical protein ACROYT_G006836 [Oculina patagonica]